MSPDHLRTFLLIAASLMVAGILLGSILLILAVHHMRKINIPSDATFAQTLHLTPIIAVLAIDLLDLGLDFLAAPISWAILDRLGLKALRGVATAEALIPGTQIIPTMTLCWIAVRLLRIEY